MRNFLLLSFLALALPLEAAQLYKWVDADGKVHYSDKPPAGNVSAEKQKIKKLQNVDQSYTAVQEANLVHENYGDDPAPAKSKKNQKWEKWECARLARELEVTRGPVIYYDENGREIKYTEKERQADEANLQAQFEKHC